MLKGARTEAKVISAINKSTASGAIYARSPILEKKIIEISYSPVKWRDNRANVDTVLFILAILYKSRQMMLGCGSSGETGWKPGLKPKAAFLVWFFGGFRCGYLLFFLLDKKIENW